MSCLKQNYIKNLENNINKNLMNFKTCNGQLNNLLKLDEYLKDNLQNMKKNTNFIKEKLWLMEQSKQNNQPILNKINFNIKDFKDDVYKYFLNQNHKNELKSEEIKSLQIECNYLKKKIKDLDEYLLSLETRIYKKN